MVLLMSEIAIKNNRRLRPNKTSVIFFYVFIDQMNQIAFVKHFFYLRSFFQLLF